MKALLFAATFMLSAVAVPVAGASTVDSSTTKSSVVTGNNKTGVLKPGTKFYPVTGISDGDTIKVDVKGTIETIRFIGIDTPETKDPRKPVQCYGPEATSKMQSLVQEKKVALVADSSQGDRDRYGRLLRYVFLEDGRHVGYEMIRGGYAHEYTYATAYQYQAEFREAERLAQQELLGFWSPDTCNGITNQTY